jgi:hypothetical protein
MSGPKRVRFDTNSGIAENRYVLNCYGTRQDLSTLGIELVPGMRLTLYMEDLALDGTPELLLVEAVVEEYEGHLIAHVDPSTWRHEPAPPRG